MRNFVSTKSAQSAFWPLYECFFFNLSLSWLPSSLPLLFLLPPPTSSPSSPCLLTLPPHPTSSPYLLTLPPYPTSSPCLLILPPHPASSPYLLTLPPHPTSSPYLLTLPPPPPPSATPPPTGQHATLWSVPESCCARPGGEKTVSPAGRQSDCV